MRRFLIAAAALALLGAWQLRPHTQESSARAQDPAGWGTVKGQVVYNGDNPPKQEVIQVKQDNTVCEAHGKVLDETWVVDPKSKGVRDVFVWLEDPSGNPLPINPSLKDVKPARVEMDQPACQFIPHALAVREGQILVIKNSAPIAHNSKVTGNPLVNPGINPLLPPGGSAEVKDLKADRLPIRVECNIHPWMNAWIRVFDSPYYAVTDKQGKFEIKDAPAGNYVMKVWHGGSGWLGGAKGKAGQPITIKAGGDTDVGELKIGPAKKS